MLGVRKNPYRELEKRLGVRFRNRDLLTTALTHPSGRLETGDTPVDNQRMEFLGDAVLDVLLAEYLYRLFPHHDEGVLTAMRSRVVSGQSLAAYARGIDLGRFLLIGKGEESSGGRNRPSALADALEAVLGAAYLDQGLRGARKVFEAVIVAAGMELDSNRWVGNPKGALQDVVQRRWKAPPVYTMVAADGPSHARVFTAEVILPDGSRTAATGGNKQEAEAEAARACLRRLQDEAAPSIPSGSPSRSPSPSPS